MSERLPVVGDDGLCFECTGCGDCCRGEGYVWVEDSRPADGRPGGHWELRIDVDARVKGKR